MRTNRGLHRLVTFLDAVVAIAITLLVLPLLDVVAEVPGDEPVRALWEENVGHVGALVLSFVVIFRMWLVHHRLTERVAGYDRPFVWWNIAWVFTLVVMPLPTALVAGHARDPATVAFYTGTILAGTAVMTALTVHVRNHPELWEEGVRREDLAVAETAANSVALTLALVLALLVPAVQYWSLLLLTLADPAVSLLRRIRGHRVRTP